MHMNAELQHMSELLDKHRTLQASLGILSLRKSWLDFVPIEIVKHCHKILHTMQAIFTAPQLRAFKWFGTKKNSVCDILPW